jgi:hypothetical protein
VKGGSDRVFPVSLSESPLAGTLSDHKSYMRIGMITNTQPGSSSACNKHGEN